MSLRDTLAGAQKEAQEAGNLPTGRKSKSKSGGKKKDDAEDVKNRPRTYKSSAATAKPSREAASSVRVSEKSSASLGNSKESKDAKKAARRKQRDEEDFRQRGYEVVLRSNERYHQTERTWWILIGVGFALTLVTLVIVWLYPTDSSDYTSVVGAISVIALIAAYALIIGGFVYDWVVRRPIRKATERQVASYSDKKIADILEKERKRLVAEEAEKQAKKQARKGKKQ
ncbi:MAG: APC family permease [Tractidigestivibacter sp.]|jgi:hypothetical protein|uniref:APC family permease n=1 Tax=Tractidigestivibacter sp. TaxID=2847320 RepID=UPI003D8F68DA